ncbi:VCBS repeat-containing protein [Streptomyces sp. NBC_00433]
MRHHRISRTRLAVATAVAFAAGIAGLPGVAAADDAPPAPGISVGIVSVEVNGASAEWDVTVTDPPAADAYVRLTVNDGGTGGLHITDDAGNALPLVDVPGSTGQILIGAEDSDHDGVPGAPMSAGVIRLHVSATYPVPTLNGVRGFLEDGATGADLAHTAYGTNGSIEVHEPFFQAVWQDPDRMTGGSYVDVATGDKRATTGHVVTGQSTPLAPVTSTRLTITAASIAGSGYTPEQLASALHLSYSTDAAAYASQELTVAADGSLTVEFPGRQWTVGGTAGEYLKLTADWGLPAGKVIARAQTLDQDGKVRGSTAAELTFTTSVLPADLRSAFYGRDSAGVLWQYQSTPDVTRPGQLASRTSVGGGWQGYTALAPLGAFKADGTGDLVARDASGVLWLYRGTGSATKPFANRVRIGGGWNIYPTLVGAGDLTGDGHADLLGRDSAGVLWLYRGTGSATKPLADRVRVGGGWQGYTTLTGAGDVTGDGRGDLLAVDSAGKMWLYASTGNAAAPYRNRAQIGGGWQIYNRVVGVADMTGDGHPDLLARDPAGRLWYYRGTGNPAAPYASRVQNGTGWNIFNTLL